jgi:hypothetical protein
VKLLARIRKLFSRAEHDPDEEARRVADELESQHAAELAGRHGQDPSAGSGTVDTGF